MLTPSPLHFATVIQKGQGLRLFRIKNTNLLSVYKQHSNTTSACYRETGKVSRTGLYFFCWIQALRQ